MARPLSRRGARDARARHRRDEVADDRRAGAAPHGVALVPQGGNTSMVGGATPPADGSALILSLRRMNRIRSLSAEDDLAVAEAGVILADLHDGALERRAALSR